MEEPPDEEAKRDRELLDVRRRRGANEGKQTEDTRMKKDKKRFGEMTTEELLDRLSYPTSIIVSVIASLVTIYVFHRYFGF